MGEEIIVYIYISNREAQSTVGLKKWNNGFSDATDKDIYISLPYTSPETFCANEVNARPLIIELLFGYQLPTSFNSNVAEVRLVKVNCYVFLLPILFQFPQTHIYIKQ